MAIKLFYHSNDLDGYASAAIVAHKKPISKFIPIDYGDEFPIEEVQKHDVVVMVDFCPDNFDYVQEIIDKTAVFVLIDHHKTAREKMQGVQLEEPSCFITDSDDNQKAACELTWNYFFPNVEIPYHLKLLADYDIWNHTDQNVLPFQYGARSYFKNPKEDMQRWKRLFLNNHKEHFDKLIKAGHHILNYEKKRNAKLAESLCFEFEFQGLKTIAVNRACINSKFFDSVYDNHDLMIAFGWNGWQWRVSFYSSKIDVSEIAEQYGGGGHAGAAGVETNQLPEDLKACIGGC